MGKIKYGSILCQRCAGTRTGRICKHSSDCMHDACFIRIKRGKDCYNIFHDQQGKVHSWASAYSDLMRINAEIKEGRFDPTYWIRAEIEQRKFEMQYATWLEQKKKEMDRGSFSQATLRLYESYNTHHFQGLNELDVRAIRLKDLQTLVDAMPKGLSLKYIQNMMNALKTFFKWAIRWGTLDKLPVFPEIKGDGGKVSRAIRYQDQLDAIENLPEEHREIFSFMRETALRISECCALKVKDLDLGNSRVLIQRTFSERKIVERTKQRKKNWIPLTDESYEIAERRAHQRFGEDFLFLNPKTGNAYLPDFLRRLWRKHSKIPLTLYESMRHSTISDWANSGANAFTIRDGARHTDIRTSARYVHNAMTDVRAMMNRAKVIHINEKKAEQQGDGKQNQ